MFGTPPGEAATSTSQHAVNLRTRLDAAYHRVCSQLGLQQRRHKALYDQKASGPPYKLHDLVWLHCPAVQRGKCRKFQLLNSPRRRVVHFDRLKPHRGSEGQDGRSSTHNSPGTARPNCPAQPQPATEDEEYLDLVWERDLGNLPAPEPHQATTDYAAGPVARRTSVLSSEQAP